MSDHAGTRLSDAEAIKLYRGATLRQLGRMAFEACANRHPEPERTYVVDRNINYSNRCTARCRFCAFRAGWGGRKGWTLTTEQILGEIRDLVAIGGRQILLQGGLHPTWPLERHVRMLEQIKQAFPGIHVHGFSPPEVYHLAERSGLGIAGVLARLREAGLDSLPGGGAEILVDRVRREISPGKCLSDGWLEVMRQAHRLGMLTTATMMLGHVESDAERIEHLRRLRDLQAESLSRGRGRFTAFICWTFQATHTELGQIAGPDGAKLRLSGAHEYLRTLALARLYLDNFENLQASWVTQGPKVGQLALYFGANDMGSVMMAEKVVSAAGTTYRLDEGDIRRLIADAGFQPRRRNCAYQRVD